MADTYSVDVVDDAWTLVATGPAIGYMTEEGSVSKLKYREAAVLPTDAIGHTLEQAVGAYVSFNVIAGQNVYVKSTNGPSKVSITLKDVE